MYHKQNYVESLKGHTEFTSANALRNSVKLAINLDSKTDRFKMEKKGGHFAVTSAVPSSFDKKVSNAFLILYGNVEFLCLVEGALSY